MLRILLIILVIGGITLCLRRMLIKMDSGTASAEKQVPKMVKCAHCELHVAMEDALQSNGRYFCGKEHLAAPGKEE